MTWGNTSFEVEKEGLGIVIHTHVNSIDIKTIKIAEEAGGFTLHSHMLKKDALEFIKEIQDALD